MSHVYLCHQAGVLGGKNIHFSEAMSTLKKLTTTSATLDSKFDIPVNTSTIVLTEMKLMVLYIKIFDNKFKTLRLHSNWS